MNTKRLLKNKGFTLIEMIVVVAIIAIMLGIVIPLFSIDDSNIQAAKEKARAFYSNVQELMIDEKLAGTALPNPGGSSYIYVELEIPSDSTVCDADIYFSDSNTSSDILADKIGTFTSLADKNPNNIYSGSWDEFAYSLYKILRITEIDNNYADSNKQTAYFYAEVDSKYRVVTAYYSVGDAGKVVGQEFGKECRVGADEYLTGAYPFDKGAVTSPKQKVFG